MEVVQSQREEASKSFTSERSQRRGSRLALKVDVKQPAGIALVPRSQRMSRLGSVRRAMMIKGIESAAKSAESPRSLDARLGELGMKMNVMEGDGNCQFRAAAYNLFGAQAYHAVVRQSAVEHMRKHADFFGIYFEDEREFNDYLQSMSQARTWGDELTLRAIVEVYCCEAHVITSESANWYLAYSPDTEEERDASIAALSQWPAATAKREANLSLIHLTNTLQRYYFGGLSSAGELCDTHERVQDMILHLETN
eukprot:CAMPEP_0113234162 /NCGR_PEP_ID=MMETSP0008_2-20120614/2871_1 /TAXON_ID=97485 /ORGANISM="Prymnesium parvum" /LENGTH=253 /DNA_ID=CAMNT_0000080995 /DNA_START=75 /DNA_END=835 /DNA_ORIENTATION=- /assembly_acc=CAM_ASM_000153